jgi:hypothetical protein
MARRPGATFRIGTISLAQTSASGSGRRRPRGAFFRDGRRGGRWPNPITPRIMPGASIPFLIRARRGKAETELRGPTSSMSGFWFPRRTWLLCPIVHCTTTSAVVPYGGKIHRIGRTGGNVPTIGGSSVGGWRDSLSGLGRPSGVWALRASRDGLLATKRGFDHHTWPSHPKTFLSLFALSAVT